MARTLAIRPSKALTTQGKALAVREPKTLELATVKDKTLATRPKDGAIVVGETRREGEETPRRYPPQSEDAHIGSNRLIRLGDAIAAGADPVKAGAKILSWGNKRARQKLADGGTIQRRVGGAGYGGTGSGGQVPPGRSGKKTAPDGTKDRRTADEMIRDRTPPAKQAGKPSGEPLQLGGKGKPIALEGKAKPLALEGGKKPPAKPTGAMGFASDVGGALKGKALEVKEGAEGVIPQAQAAKLARGALKDRFAEVKALWNGGKKDQAVKKAVLTGWPTIELQLDAMEWLAKRISK